MTDTSISFQLTLIRDDNLLIQTNWTSDKDAIIECMDEINHRRCSSLCAAVVEHDSRRAKLSISKNGNALVETEPFNVKDYRDTFAYICMLINTRDERLKATVTTRGNGGLAFEHPLAIGGGG